MMAILTIMMHKRKAASTYDHVVISKKGDETFDNNGHDKPRFHLVPGQQAHGGAWGPGLRSGEAIDYNDGEDRQ